MKPLFRLKELLTGTDRTAGQYECLACQTTFEFQRQVCPACGGCDIRAREWLPERAQ